VIYTDDNYPDFANDPSAGPCGCLPRTISADDLVCAAAPPKDFPLIAWDAMPDLIADEERHKSSMEHVFRDSKMSVLNQGPLNYCWDFSAVQALMLERELMGLPFVELSPSSVAAPIVHFQNVGNQIENGLMGIANQGAASTAYVPMATNNPKDFHDGWRADADQYRVTLWHDIQYSAQLFFTFLLSKKPCPNRRDRMKHSMLSFRLIDANPKLEPNDINRYRVKDLNSWGNESGDNGILTFQGQAGVPDGAYAIAQASFMG